MNNVAESLAFSLFHYRPELIPTLFWMSLCLVFYTYAGYPLFLLVHKRFRRTEVSGENYQPFVSVVIAALNEEMTIRGRLENLLLQNYSKAKLEIIIVSDGSADRTCDVVRSFANNSVCLLDLGARQGKSSALNAGVARTNGEIVVFTDARQRFAQNAVAQLVSNFSDPAVGCVSGELVLVRDDTSLIQAEMGAYWNYEKWVRKMESATGSVVGATGAIFAIRRDLYRQLPADTILDDVLTPMTIVAQGYRCVFDGSAWAYDIFSRDARHEWSRKIRTLAGNWQLLSLCPKLLVPWLNPLWWRFLSHKVMRLIVPFALVTITISGLLITNGFYLVTSLALLFLCLLAVISAVLPSVRILRLMSVNFFFMVMNAAVLAGFWFWITGRCVNIWQQSRTDGYRRSE